MALLDLKVGSLVKSKLKLKVNLLEVGCLFTEVLNLSLKIM
jgi:hypothetical protein